MVRSCLGNPFGHMTRLFPLRISRENVIVGSNRLHLDLSNDKDAHYSTFLGQQVIHWAI